MTRKYKYKIVSPDFTFEVKDSVIGWEDKKIILARDDFHGINIDFADNITFSGKTRENILHNFMAYGISNQVFLECYSKDNITQAYSLFKKYLLDFSTLKNNINGENANRCTISLIDSGIRPIIEARKDQKYTIEIPSEKQKTLNFDGTRLISSMELQLGAGDLISYKTSPDGNNSFYHIPARVATSSYNANLSFVNEDMSTTNNFSIRVLNDTELSLELNIKDLYLYMAQFSIEPFEGRIYLIARKKNGSQRKISFYLGNQKKTYLSPTFIERKTILTPAAIYALALPSIAALLYTSKVLTEKYEYETPLIVTNEKVYKDETVELVYYGSSGKIIGLDLAWYIKPTVLGLYPYEGKNQINVGSETYISTSNYTNSAFYGKQIKLTDHKDLLEAVLNKILELETNNGEYTLDYKIIHEHFKHLICGSDSFRFTSDTPKINICLSDILKDLYCNYGAYYEITDNTFIVDYSRNAFLNEASSRKLININNISWKVDLSHLYTSLSVGYSTSDADKDNGRFAFCCENNFTTPMVAIDKKELNLKSPFIADCYSIEDAMNKAKNEAEKDNSTDENIFSFACIESGDNYVLCRDYAKDQNGNSIISGTFDLPTVYNMPISPKRMIIANLAYISISSYGLDGFFKFTSSDKNAEVYSQMSWENEIVYENSDFSKINYLFLPIIISFDCGDLWESLFDIQKHHYYEVIGLTGWINKLELSAGFNSSQNIELIAKEI